MVRQERTYHVAWLCLTAAVLLVAALLRVRSDQRVEFVFAPGRPLPELCQMKLVHGLECPGCGLTRCFVHAVHGAPTAAAKANPAGLLLFLLIASQVPYRVWMFSHPTTVQWSTRGLVLVLAIPPTLLVVQWAVRLLWR